ncbi:MAG: type II toxin-antitoxin system HicB family antitoxin [Sulfuricellaceae bacterium]
MNKINYPALFDPQPDGGYTITFPDLPEAITEGDTEDEACFNAAEVLSLCLAVRLEAGDAIPEASPPDGNARIIEPDAATQAALLIHQARGARSLAELARALGTSWPAAQRLENPRHSPTLKQLERAAAALGKRLVLTFE